MPLHKHAATCPSFRGFVISALCTALLLSGCASVSIKSARDPSFSSPINKLFIILNHAQIDRVDRSYTPCLIASLRNEFSQRGMTPAIGVVNALTLDENAYLAEIAANRPEGVLTITVAGGEAGLSGVTKIIYDVSLFDSSYVKRIWRAQIDASGGIGGREKSMKMMATELVRRLTEDRLISPEPRKNGDREFY